MVGSRVDFLIKNYYHHHPVHFFLKPIFADLIEYFSINYWHIDIVVIILIINNNNLLNSVPVHKGWDSVVGIATRYGLNGPGIEFR